MSNDTITIQALKEAVEIAGGQSALARSLGTRQQVVWNWIHQAGRCPATMAIPIEEATGVSRTRLRPDLYPEAA